MSEQAQKPPESSGISYALRRVQTIDAVILAGVLAVFAFVFNTDRNVTALRAEKDAEAKLEARDPVIRESRYKNDMGVMRSRMDSAEARVEQLESAGKK